MRFPNAAKGVSKIFSAEILSIIASILLGVTVILAFVTDKSVTDNNETAAGVAGISMLVGLIAAVVIFVVGGILNIIGYIQAAIDEDGFKKAIWCTIASIVFGAVGAIFAGNIGFLGWFSTACDVVSKVLMLLVFLFAVGGLMNLSANCHRQDMVDTGALLIKIFGWLVVLYVIILIITRVFRENALNTAVATFFTVLSTILSIAQFIIYLVYLHRAKIMLREN